MVKHSCLHSADANLLFALIHCFSETLPLWNTLLVCYNQTLPSGWMQKQTLSFLHSVVFKNKIKVLGVRPCSLSFWLAHGYQFLFSCVLLFMVDVNLHFIKTRMQITSFYFISLKHLSPNIFTFLIF